MQWTLEGLPDEPLRRPVLPSGWTCLGLVRHLTLDDERFWFRAVVAGERVNLESGTGAWQILPQVPARAVLEEYRQEIALADAVIAATPWTARLPGGPRTSSAPGGSMMCGRSSCI